MPMIRSLAALLMALALPALAQVRPLPPPSPLDAPPKEAIETATGIHYIVLKPAPKPEAYTKGDFIEFTANAWSSDGVTRINGTQSGRILTDLRRLRVDQPALARAIKSTPIGETRRWWIDAERMKPGYPKMPDLPHVIEVTVLGEQDPTRAPADVSEPPADAIRTPSGLAYKVLVRGNGAEGHPSPDDLVRVHYTGWTAIGQMFDSSVERGRPATFPLAQLIPGWREGLQLMRRGDTFRFWIPGKLAYDEMPGSTGPKGMLVFDVTLYSFGPPLGSPPPAPKATLRPAGSAAPATE